MNKCCEKWKEREQELIEKFRVWFGGKCPECGFELDDPQAEWNNALHHHCDRCGKLLLICNCKPTPKIEPLKWDNDWNYGGTRMEVVGKINEIISYLNKEK